MKLQIFTDGGSRGNPGHAAIGFLLFDGHGKLIFSGNRYIGKTTNNVAEYEAIITAFAEAARQGATEIDAYMDSQLACRQLQGVYKVKDARLQMLMGRIREIEKAFKKIHYTHVPRENEKIQMADRLVNEALDQATGKGDLCNLF